MTRKNPQDRRCRPTRPGPCSFLPADEPIGAVETRYGLMAVIYGPARGLCNKCRGSDRLTMHGVDRRAALTSPWEPLCGPITESGPRCPTTGEQAPFARSQSVFEMVRRVGVIITVDRSTVNRWH